MTEFVYFYFIDCSFLNNNHIGLKDLEYRHAEKVFINTTKQSISS